MILYLVKWKIAIIAWLESYFLSSVDITWLLNSSPLIMHNYTRVIYREQHSFIHRRQTWICTGAYIPTILSHCTQFYIFKHPITLAKPTGLLSDLAITFLPNWPVFAARGVPRPGVQLKGRLCRRTRRHRSAVHGHLLPGWLLLTKMAADSCLRHQHMRACEHNCCRLVGHIWRACYKRILWGVVWIRCFLYDFSGKGMDSWHSLILKYW